MSLFLQEATCITDDYCSNGTAVFPLLFYEEHFFSSCYPLFFQEEHFSSSSELLM